MSTFWNRMKSMLGVGIPMSMGVLALSAGTAQAQYTMEGSDTLTQVVESAIAQSGANITYSNTGSGQGEKNLAQVGCPSAGVSGQHFRQGVAPMSRNLQAAIISWCPTWAPGQTNGGAVLGLDAAVFGVRNYTGHAADLTIHHDASDVTLADNGPQSDLSLIFFGYDAAGASALHGTTTQCAAPQRLAALSRLTNQMSGIAQIDHIYRRDDASGTQDTIREHLAPGGTGYWCNGKSEGNLGAFGSNQLNEDLDPIRRACVGADSTHAQTRCTYYPTAMTCKFGDDPITHPTYGQIKCTQGLIVALSENDPDGTCKQALVNGVCPNNTAGRPDYNYIADITISIANRIKNDTFNQTAGMAGRAMVEQSGAPTAGLTVNTVTYTDANIRGNQYFFSRRLYIQRNPSGSGDAGRDAQEVALYNWMTNKCNLDPIMRSAGFLSCQDDCTAPCLDTSNLCCIPPLAGASIKKQNIGAEAVTVSGITYNDLGDGNHPCVQAANTTAAASGVSCGTIASMGTGAACNTSSKCSNGTCALDSSNISGTCN